MNYSYDELEQKHNIIKNKSNNKDALNMTGICGSAMIDNVEGQDCFHYDVTSCGPNRRGYLAITEGEVQFIICTQSEMKSDVNRRVALGQHVLQLEDQIEVLPEEIQKIAEVELRETPERKEKSLKELKELLIKEREENGLLSPEDNDVILIAYLRATHYYVDSAFKRITNYYRFKQKHSYYVANLIPNNEIRAFENNLLTVLPNRDQYNRRVLVLRAGKQWDPNTCTVRELVRGIMMVVKAATLEPVTQTAGAILIADVKDLGYSQMKHLVSLSLAEMLVTWVQDCFPFRLKAIHVVNINALFGLVLNVFKKFLNEKFQKRVMVHTKLDTLGIAKEILPKDLGGTLADLPDNQGLLLHKLLSLYGDQYEMVSKFGYPKEEKKEKKGWFY